MKPLEPPDNHHLRAALGWIGLGNFQEANEELEKIAPQLRAHPDVLTIRYVVYAKTEKWDVAAEIAGALVKLTPEEPHAWICLAYATRRKPGGGIPQAREILTQAQPKFPDYSLIPYNLACYECRLGNLETAKRWLEKAFACGDAEGMKLMALADADLEPMRKEIAQMRVPKKKRRGA